MSHLTFLSLPATIREQIYGKLVTYAPLISERARVPSSPICKLLLVNRQCHVEVLEFIELQLLVLIQTNDAELFVHNILKEASVRRLPIVSQLKTRDDAPHKDISKAPVAMKMEIYVYNIHSSSTSFPAFLIPASSLKPLLSSILWLPDWQLWTMQSSLSLEIINTFRYSRERAEELLIDPWVDWVFPQTFAGIEIDSSISVNRINTIKQRLIGKYEATTLIYGVVSLTTEAGASERNEELDEAIGQYMKAEKYAKLIWNCQLSCLQDQSTFDFARRDWVWRLWLAIEFNGTRLFRCILRVARERDFDGIRPIPIGSARDNEGCKRARRVMEDVIRFLSEHPPCASTATFHHPEVRSMIRNHQIMAIHRLFVVCKKLGDVDAAVGYLREAEKYDPNNAALIKTKIDKLVDGGARDEEEAWKGVVRWHLTAPTTCSAS